MMHLKEGQTIPEWLIQEGVVWNSVPSLPGNPSVRGIEKVDIMGKMEWLLGDKELMKAMRGAIRVIDFADGCGVKEKGDRHMTGVACETCLVGALKIRRMIDPESWQELTGDSGFRSMVRQERLRVGSVANLLDLRRRGVELMETTLSRLSKRGREVKLLVNYRKGYEDSLIRLIDLRKQYRNFILQISLPFNTDWQVNVDFGHFFEKQVNGGRFYAAGRWLEEEGLRRFEIGETLTEDGRVTVYDVPHSGFYFKTGRVLPEAVIPDDGRVISGDNLLLWRRRGLASIGLWPDGLWVKIYGTGLDTPTSLAYVHLRDKDALRWAMGKLALHPDFKSEFTSWPSGFGKIENVVSAMRTREATKLKGGIYAP